MSLFGPTIPDRIRTSFQFLVDSGGYRLIAESEGLGGAITYRSAELWIAAEWDRSLPWLDFSPTRDSAGRFDWILIDLLLKESERYDRDVEQSEVAEPEALADWLKPRLGRIEAAFRQPQLAETNATLKRYAQQRGRAREAYWQDLQRKYQQAHSSDRAV